MYYCEPCRAQRGWPVNENTVTAHCELCGKGPQQLYNVSAMAIPMPDPNLDIDSPFMDPPVDPRAELIEQQREAMASGRGASVSLAPNYEVLKTLTKWLADNGWDAQQVADAVARPNDYWVYYSAAKEGGDLASGD
jgi:hypothetical protein